MPIQRFLKLESASGILLIATAALAFALDNSPLGWLYDELLSVPLEIRIGTLEIAKPLLLWINDGLMAIFFLLVGLEIKREVLTGELSTRDRALLPAFAAVGGMAVPALIYAAINWGEPTLDGWAIPTATDIAFTLGILSLVGSRVPLALKVFLTAVAILDDLSAILVIAIFYTDNLSTTALWAAVPFVAGLIALNRWRVRTFTPYALLGIAIWVCVLKSGVHATLAGVMVAFAVPLRAGGDTPVVRLEHALHPWVAFLVMPVFAFANAGIPLAGIEWADLIAPLPLGIALGLFVGKQLGVFLFTWAPVQLGIATRPPGTTWRHLYGASLLAGIGFTMSLFIGTLAFDAAEHAVGVRLGVLAGSFFSGVLGFWVLRTAPAAPIESSPDQASSTVASEPELSASARP